MIVDAKYVKRSICPCGYSILRDEIPLGRIYRVDTERTSIGHLICGECGRQTWNLPIIYAEASDTGWGGWMFMEIFDFVKPN